jgi:hypothetical protein
MFTANKVYKCAFIWLSKIPDSLFFESYNYFRRWVENIDCYLTGSATFRHMNARFQKNLFYL